MQDNIETAVVDTLSPEVVEEVVVTESALTETTELTPEEIAELEKKKKQRRKLAIKISTKVGMYILLAALALVFLFPFLAMVCLSLLNDAEVRLQVMFSPTGTLYLGSFVKLFSSGSSYLMYLGNTLIVAAINTVGIPIVSSLCAYGFAKLDFKGKEIVFGIVLATMMIPAVISIVPLYVLYAKIGWTDTLFPMWLPSLFGGGATNIFLMRQFMRGIPNDMIKAAQLDGANSFVIYFRMVLPLCLPIMLFVAVQSFMGAWNDFMTPFTYISSRSSKAVTLALGVYYDYGPGSTRFANDTMAAGVIMTLPCIILFFVFQKFLIDGVAVTGMKD